MEKPPIDPERHIIDPERYNNDLFEPGVFQSLLELCNKLMPNKGFDRPFILSGDNDGPIIIPPPDFPPDQRDSFLALDDTVGEEAWPNHRGQRSSSLNSLANAIRNRLMLREKKKEEVEKKRLEQEKQAQRIARKKQAQEDERMRNATVDKLASKWNAKLKTEPLKESETEPKTLDDLASKWGAKIKKQ